MIAALKAVCYHVPEWRPWANLMSGHDDPGPVVERRKCRRRTRVEIAQRRQACVSERPIQERSPLKALLPS